MENDPAQKAAVEKIIKDVNVKKWLPETVTALQESLIMAKTPEEKLAIYLEKGDILQAVKLCNNFAALAPHQVDEKIKMLVETDQKKFADLVESLGGQDTLVEELYNKYQSQLKPEFKESIARIIKFQKGLQYEKEIGEHVKNIKLAAVQNFNSQYELLFDSVVKGMIGLSRSKDYNQSFGDFPSLDEFLNKPKYKYVYDNTHNATSKLRKAGPLYLIKGLQDSNPAIQKKAYESMMTLLADFSEFYPTLIKQNKDLELALKAVVTGYLQVQNNPAKAVLDLQKDFSGETKYLIIQAAGLL